MGWFTDLLKEYPALAVAKERIKLAQEKYDSVFAKNEKLKADLSKVREENAELKSRLAEDEPRSSCALEPLEVEILKLLGGGHGRDMTTSAIAAQLGISKTKIDYYVSKLCDNEYLGFPLIMGGGEPEIYIQQCGREYLVKNDLI